MSINNMDSGATLDVMHKYRRSPLIYAAMMTFKAFGKQREMSFRVLDGDREVAQGFPANPGHPDKIWVWEREHQRDELSAKITIVRGDGLRFEAELMHKENVGVYIMILKNEFRCFVRQNGMPWNEG